LDVLLELTRRLSERRPLAEALGLVTDAALELLPADHVSIRILDASGQELLSGARSGVGSTIPPARFERGVGVAGWVVETGEAARVPDVTHDERFVTLDGQGFGIRSILTVPLWSAGQVVGVLAMSSEDDDHFTESDESLASLLANCAVPPIERARLARLAVMDANTKAFNQGYLMPGIQAEMDKLGRSPGLLSLLLMDLDRFKEVNDSFGHAVGDRALREFADRVRDVTRIVDVLVRRGGDEFVLIMPGADKDSALAVAERIRGSMGEAPLHLEDGREVRLEVSVGAATWDGEESPQALEKRADDAMYAAKEGGRNDVRFSDG